MQYFSKFTELLISFFSVNKAIKVINSRENSEINSTPHVGINSLSKIGEYLKFFTVNPVDFITFDVTTVILSKLKT